ncbi:hypothetical protein [Peribacillus frigoritolerans]|uniref:hypothetical protein n=1 Tax=Peribacillus frigoritolerans TaxID=450367 RepID=UPI002E1FEF68|nr:hypothetical protein [Peribacillus frigoritolerans]
MRHLVQNKNKYMASQNVEKKELSNFNWLDTGLIIGFITAIGYFLAYSFQKGYFTYFGITEIFINKIDIANIVLAISIVGGVLYTIYIFYDSTVKILDTFSNVFIKFFKAAYLPFFISGITLVVFMPDFIKFIGFILVVILGLIFIIPLLKHKDVQGYKNKIEKELVNIYEEGFTLRNIYFAYKNIPTMRIMFTASLLLITMPIGEFLGYEKAERQREYFIIENKAQNYLVIDKFGDKFIIAPYDNKENTIQQEFQIIDINSDFELPFVYQKTTVKNKIKVHQGNLNKK